MSLWTPVCIETVCPRPYIAVDGPSIIIQAGRGWRLSWLRTEEEQSCGLWLSCTLGGEASRTIHTPRILWHEGVSGFCHRWAEIVQKGDKSFKTHRSAWRVDKGGESKLDFVGEDIYLVLSMGQNPERTLCTGQGFLKSYLRTLLVNI